MRLELFIFRAIGVCVRNVVTWNTPRRLLGLNHDALFLSCNYESMLPRLP